jgi:hypothetical protein
MRYFLLLLFIFNTIIINTHAQNEPIYKPFSIDIGAGYAFQQSGSPGGIIYINPGYTIAGRFRAGVQFGLAGYCETYMNSSILTLDYYLVNNPGFRISAGGGYGYYTFHYLLPGSEPPEMSQGYWNTGKMGGNIRIGFEWHHLDVRLAYHFAPDLYESNSYIGEPTVTTMYKGNYLGLTIGILIGGGKNKIKK